MIRTLVFAVVLALAGLALSSGGAQAAPCTVPNLLTNGQTADATQVMANLYSLLDCINVTIVPTGTPVTGSLTKFSGATSITNADLSGDVTTAGGTATTLATVNANVGSFGSATQAATITVNAKGLVTAASNTPMLPLGCANPCAIGTPDVRSGAGAPGPNDPMSSLYMRTDVSQLWRQQTPLNAVPARVQEASAVLSYTVTLGAAPTPGNYLIAYGEASGSLPSAASGWTSIATHNPVSADPYARLAYHLVVSGDTAVQTSFTGGSGMAGVSVVEVSGLDPIWANSFQASAFNQATAGGGCAGTCTASATNTATTTAANTLGIGFGGSYGASGGGAPAITFNAGWTHVSSAGYAVGAGGSQVSAGAASQLYASNGASVTETPTATSNGFISPHGITAALVLVKPASGANTGWRLTSDLTTIMSGGVAVTPAGTSARSINFSTGLTATDDGSGNTTVTASGGGGGLTPIAANSLLANATGSTALPVANAVPPCSTPNSALTYTTSSGFGCNTIALTAANGSTGSMQLIQEVITSGSATTVTFSSIPQNYRDLRVVVTGRGTTAATTTTVGIQFNGDSASNYSIINLNGTGAATSSVSSASSTSGQIGLMPAASATANRSGVMQALIGNYAGTTFHKAFTSEYSAYYGSTLAQIQGLFGGHWASTAAITSLTLNLSAGGFVDGTSVALYGVGGAPLSRNIGAEQLIQQTVTSGSAASVAVPAIPQNYRDLRVVITGATNEAATTTLVNLTFNGDTGPNYDYQYVRGHGTSATAVATMATTAIPLINVPGTTAPANTSGTGDMTIHNYASTIFEKEGLGSWNMKQANVSTSYYVYYQAAAWRSTMAITSLTLTPAASTFRDGTVVSVYGIGGSGGTGTSSGTSFPTAPMVQDRFYRSDRNIEYFWDGTRWLSTQLFTIPVTNSDALLPLTVTTAGALRAGNPYSGQYDFYVTDVVWTNFINSVGTWTFTLQKWTAGSTASVATANSTGDAASQMVSHRIPVNAPVASTSQSFQADFTKTSGGNVYPQVSIQGRLIGLFFLPAWIGRRRRRRAANDNPDQANRAA